MDVKLPESLDEALVVIEDLFDCRFGHPSRTYDFSGDEDKCYIVLAWETAASEHAIAYLRLQLINSLKLLRGQTPNKPILYWRNSSRIEESEYPLYHYDLISKKGLQKGRRELIRKIYTRLAIPGADFSLVTVKRECEPTPRLELDKL